MHEKHTHRMHNNNSTLIIKNPCDAQFAIWACQPANQPAACNDDTYTHHNEDAISEAFVYITTIGFKFTKATAPCAFEKTMMQQQIRGRDPFASGGSTKRLYEVGRVGFNTVVDQTLMKKHARIMQSDTATADEKTIKRFKNSCGDTVTAEVSGSVVPQEPLFVCMGHNASGANALYDSLGRPLNNVQSCHVSSSLNHLQCTTDSRFDKLKVYVDNAVAQRQAIENAAAGVPAAPPGGPAPPAPPAIGANVLNAIPITGVAGTGTGTVSQRNTPFLPDAREPQNIPGIKFLEDLAIYRDLAPTFVGFASGSYEAPPSTELIKKPPHLAGNCGGLMTVQATAFVHGRGGRKAAEKEARKGIEIGQRLCVTYPRADWHNCQAGVLNKKTTLVVCDADKAQSEHRRNFDAIRGEAVLVEQVVGLPGNPQQINRRVEFLYDSYMTRPLEIGQCRSGCRTEGQMMDIKYDLAAPNIQDLITFAFGMA